MECDFMNLHYVCGDLSAWSWELSQWAAPETAWRRHRLTVILTTVYAAERSICVWEIMPMWDTRHELTYSFFLIKEHWCLPTQMVKAFTFTVLSEAAISSSSHDNNAHGILENTHSTAQRQTLQVISSEGAGFQIAGSWSRERIKDWTSYEKLSSHRFP